MKLWTLESELIKLAKKETWEDASNFLFGEGHEAHPNYQLSSITNWYRSGAETYSLSFFWGSRRFFLKACCPSFGAKSIDTVLQSWIERRKILMEGGVSTPKLYAYGNGLILEEYIPFNLDDISISDSNIESLINQVRNITNVLIEEKFNPVNPFRNLMSRGDDIVWVDFGQDLSDYGNRDANIGSLADQSLLFMQELALRRKVF